METKKYKKDEIVFRQGDAAQSMFSIEYGSVGIYLDYGTAKEKKLAELTDGDTFGEMGMIDRAPRSATAVALENGTTIAEITEKTLGELFEKNPAKVLMIMQELSKRLRRLTKEYMNVCQLAAEMTRSQNGEGNEKDLVEKTERIEERRNGILAYES